MDASLGNFDFKVFLAIEDPGMKLFGEVMIIVIVITFNMLLFNLIIAILANTYNMFDLRSNGLYLSKILNTRGELLFDENYGAFLAGIPPFNIVQVPFIPLALWFKKYDRWLIKMNSMLLKLQYCIFMLMFFLIFIVVSFALIPIAWIVGIFDKLKASSSNYNKVDKMCNYLFIPFGPIILVFNVLCDLNYFWKNNFRDELKQNIIQKEDS